MTIKIKMANISIFRNELYLLRRDLVQQGHGPLIPFIIFQCLIIISKKL